MAEQGIEVTWTSGGRGVIVESDGKFVVTESDTAAAPGTPLAGTTSAETTTRYEIKVRGCKRISESPVRYRIDGRFMNLSAKDRQALLAQLKKD